MSSKNKKKLVLPPGMDLDLTDISQDFMSKKRNKGFFLEEVEEFETEFIRTGLPGVDYAIGGVNHPGIPKGRIVELFGSESSGKSTLALWIMSALLKNYDGIGLYFDIEQVYNYEIAEKFGILPNRILVSQPATVDETFKAQEEIIEKIKGKYPDKPLATVIDSVGAFLSEDEYKGEYGEKFYGGIAKSLTQGLKKFNPVIRANKIIAIYVNQLREKMNAGLWEEKDDTPGGRAMKHFASVRVKCSKSSTIKKDKTVLGHTVVIKCKKNKVAPPLKEATFDIIYNSSYFIDYIGHLLDWLKDNDLIPGSTGYYEINSKKYRKDQARELLLEDEELYQELLDKAYTVTDFGNKDEEEEDDE